MDGYNCFGCASTNKFGLQMEFFEAEDEIVSFWEPREQFQGYFNVLHGGIQATLIDEIASWYVFVKLKTAGVTASLNVKYKKSVYTNKEGKITLKARLLKKRRNIAEIEVELFDQEMNRCALGKADYFTFSKDKAEKDFNYPAFDEFYK